MENNNPGLKDQNSSNAPMEQVREILFGAQIKDMEVRFQRQEERLLREIHDVKDLLKKRLDSLENFMKSEVSALLERVKREQDERETVQRAEQKERTEALAAEQRERIEAAKNEQRDRAEAIKNEQRERSEALAAEARERQDAVAKLSGELASANENFERRLTKLSATLDATERDLRSLLLTESGDLTDKIESKYTDALNVLAKTASQIRADMVYRTALSGMFAELVGGLSKPWNQEALGLSSAEEQGRELEAPEQPEAAEDEDDSSSDNQIPQVVRVGSADSY